jgi:hypothetical protein
MRRGQECPHCQIIGKTRDADTKVKRRRPLPEYVHMLLDRFAYLNTALKGGKLHNYYNTKVGIIHKYLKFPPSYTNLSLFKSGYYHNYVLTFFFELALFCKS